MAAIDLEASDGRPRPWTLADLSSSDESPSSEGSEGSGGSDASHSSLSAELPDPGRSNPAARPDVPTSQLIEVPIGYWIVPDAATRNVVYPYSDKRGHISYRVQPFDDEGNLRPSSQSRVAFREASWPARPSGYFEYVAALIDPPAGAASSMRLRVRALIAQHLRDMEATAHSEQDNRHETREAIHAKDTPRQQEEAYRMELTRRAVRRAVRRAERAARRQADRRIARLEALNSSEGYVRESRDGIDQWVYRPPLETSGKHGDKV